jgi:hypothetical protein
MSSPFELLEAELGGRLNLKETGNELHKKLLSAYRFFKDANHSALMSDPMFDAWFDLHIKNSRINEYETNFKELNEKSLKRVPPEEPLHFVKQRKERERAEQKQEDDREYRELLSCVNQKDFERFITKMVYYATLRYGRDWSKELHNENDG